MLTAFTITAHLSYPEAMWSRACANAQLTPPCCPGPRRRLPETTADNGAAHRAGRNDTAFSFRDANFVAVIAGVDPDPANNERMIQWAKDYWLALHPYSSGGGYVNMMMDEGADNVKAAYRENYGRLAEIKAAYDPTNLSHINQNVKPAP